MTCLPGGQPLLVAFAAYALFVALCVVAPALAVLRLLRAPIDPAALVPLGLGLCAGAYALGLVTGWPWLFVLLLVVLVATGFVGARGRPWSWTGPSLRGALPPAFALVALFGLTQYRLNRCTPDGGFALDGLERVDTAFHVAVTWELRQGYPPQVPGLAGVPLHYHFGPHLVRAAAARFAGIHPYDALARLDLTLWALALVLAWRSAASALGAPSAVVTLMPWTLLLGDLSWLLAAHARGAWLTELLGANLLVVLFFTNALVPALAMLLAALAALARVERDGDRGALALAASLGLALPFFKVFLAVQWLAGLALAFALGRARRVVACAALPCLLAVCWLAAGSGAASLRVQARVFEVAQQARVTLGLDAASGPLLAVSALAWLLLSLGVRVVGLPLAVRALRSRSAAGVALAGMALMGFALRLGLQLSADGHFDEGVYFSVQSGALLWFFGMSALASAWHDGARFARLAVVVAFALALPTSAEFVLRKTFTPGEHVPAGVLRATARLVELTAPGEVVLMPPAARHPPPPVVFIGRRAAWSEYLPYLRQFASVDLLAERERALRRLFRGLDEDASRRLAKTLGARYVAAYGRASAVESAAWLEKTYDADGVRLYRARWPGE